MKAAGGDSGKTEAEEKEKEEQRAVNPMREEAYAFIGCLHRVWKMYNIQGYSLFKVGNAELSVTSMGPSKRSKTSAAAPISH